MDSKSMWGGKNGKKINVWDEIRAMRRTPFPFDLNLRKKLGQFQFQF